VTRHSDDRFTRIARVGKPHGPTTEFEPIDEPGPYIPKHAQPDADDPPPIEYDPDADDLPPVEYDDYEPPRAGLWQHPTIRHAVIASLTLGLVGLALAAGAALGTLGGPDPSVPPPAAVPTTASTSDLPPVPSSSAPPREVPRRAVRPPVRKSSPKPTPAKTRTVTVTPSPETGLEPDLPDDGSPFGGGDSDGGSPAPDDEQQGGAH
jgi:hypothetical protein